MLSVTRRQLWFAILILIRVIGVDIAVRTPAARCTALNTAIAKTALILVEHGHGTRKYTARPAENDVEQPTIPEGT